ncbi:hypothetical protein BU16DRAFT_527775 [Lophium mytilinum]|uniref:Uncharacterized protein n=1 Tax=Lophium mytilinum TaxID=390894 RepID=A0A6A6QRI9_9PEZI|nr:hypothetical protein BU16DRAFT_527775 [Lophium mytilinum]
MVWVSTQGKAEGQTLAEVPVPVGKKVVAFEERVGREEEGREGARRDADVPVPRGAVELSDSVWTLSDADTVVKTVPVPTKLVEFAYSVGAASEADAGAVPVPMRMVEFADSVGTSRDAVDTAVLVPSGIEEFTDSVGARREADVTAEPVPRGSVALSEGE